MPAVPIKFTGPIKSLKSRFEVVFRNRVRVYPILNLIIDTALCVSIAYGNTRYKDNDRFNASKTTFHVSFRAYLVIKLVYCYLVNIPYGILMICLGRTVPSCHRKKILGWLLVHVIDVAIAAVGVVVYNQAKCIYGCIEFSGHAFDTEYRAMWQLAYAVYIATIVVFVVMFIRPLFMLIQLYRARRVTMQFFVVRSPNSTIPTPTSIDEL